MDGPREYGLYIDGKFESSSNDRWTETHDPSNGELVARVASPTARDARAAVEAARRAADGGGWADLSPEARRDALLPILDGMLERNMELAELEARDAGITIRYASLITLAALQHARELIERTAAMPLTESLPHAEFPLPAHSVLMREPYGVVTAIVPFNAPLELTMWKIAPALAAGNTVVLKPSPYTPCTAMELALAFSASDVPPGVFNVLSGGSAEVGEELVTNPMVDRVSFTGSTEVGRRIAQLSSSTIKKVTLELGGKGANILLDDADLDVAIAGAMWGIYLHQGQVCQAGSRLFVPERLHDEVIDRLVAATSQLRVGPTMDYATDLGPLISTQQLERVERYVGIGRSEGASLVCGGHRLMEDGLADGHYFAPTIFTDVKNSSRLAQEEIFGPVLSVIPYRDVDEAVRMANDTIFGLTAGVWSTDTPRALAVARRLQAGTIWLNEWHVLTTGAPYGGYKQSGLGKELGDEGVLEYMRSKHVWVDQTRELKQKVWGPIIGLDRIFDIRYD